MINSSVRLSARVRGYVRENWGARFYLGVMLFLIVAAVSLSMGLSVLANEVAIAAYYALVRAGLFSNLFTS